ncbi:MAG: mCpol domain-containing protein [Ktedonobacteraceae bacterium]
MRYKQIIKKHANKYEQIDRIAADRNFFEGNLAHSIQLKLLGDRKGDSALYRIVSSSVSASVEDLISILIDKFIPQRPGTKDARRTLGDKLSLVESEIKKISPLNFDFDFFQRLNSFVLYLRNSSTHKSSKLSKLEYFKADISTKITLPFIELYNEIIYPILAEGKIDDQQMKIQIISPLDINPEDVFYFGVDGDNTGLKLEDLFLFANDELKLQKMSCSIEQAISESVQFIKKNFLNGEIIYSAGDNILFKGCFNETALQELQRIYHSITSGMTCSIGFGRSFREVYLALKLAKTEPGKNHIIGVEFI